MGHQKNSAYANKAESASSFDGEATDKSQRYHLKETRTNVYKALHSIPKKIHKKATETRMSLHYTLTSMTQLVKQANKQQFQKAREKKNLKHTVLLIISVLVILGACGFILYLLCNSFAFCAK